MKNISLILFLFFAVNSYSQNEIQAELDMGYAFQREIDFDDHDLEDTGGVAVRLGLNYLIYLNDNFFIETGMYGKYNKGQKKIRTLHFTYNSFRVQMPLYAGYAVNDQWKVNIGAGIENNVDFDKIDFKKKHNLRYDLLTKVVYDYNPKVQFSFYTNWMISYAPDFSTISSPKNGVFLGVIYNLKK